MKTINEYRYYIKKTSRSVEDALILELGDIRGAPIFDFRPGQYIMISYRDTWGKMQEKHAFSIASSPTKRFSLRLGIRIMGKFTQGLVRLKEGDEIFVSGPFGNFVFDEERHSDLVFIAGGIGITPFMSSIMYAADRRLSNRMSLLYSNRTLGGTIFLEDILEAERRNLNTRAIFSVTDEKLPPTKGKMVNSRISAQMIGDFIGSVKGKTFFICGPVKFMDAMKDNLRSIGADDSQMETEEFSMMPDASWWLRLRNMSYALGLSAAIFFLVFNIIQRSTQKTAAGNVQILPDSSTQNTPNITNNVGNNPGNSTTSSSQNLKTQPVKPIPVPSRRTRVS